MENKRKVSGTYLLVENTHEVTGMHRVFDPLTEILAARQSATKRRDSGPKAQAEVQDHDGAHERPGSNI